MKTRYDAGFTATHCNTLQHTATHCNTLQYTATHCNTLRYDAGKEWNVTRVIGMPYFQKKKIKKKSTATQIIRWQNRMPYLSKERTRHSMRSAREPCQWWLNCRNGLFVDMANLRKVQHTATHCNILQDTATHCNKLQDTTMHCNALQHTATRWNTLLYTATHCNTLHHTATHCTTPTI